jgi:hypothetical protein
MNNSLMSKITIIQDYEEQIINFPHYIPEATISVNDKYLREIEKNKELQKQLEYKNKQIELLIQKINELQSKN